MITDNTLTSEDINFIQIPECQTLDALLQSSCETSNQSDILDNTNICDLINNVEPCPKRNWYESVELYISSLIPKDTIIFIENVKVFSKGTVYMYDFRNLYFDHILKFLNGGEPLKTDFGRDEYTSLYSMYSYSAVTLENKVECHDTAMIHKVMETMETLNFTERNPSKNLTNMKFILNEALNVFQYYNNIRNNHPKRKRYLIMVTCSDLSMDEINELVEDMKSMKVRFSLFSPVKYDSHVNLCDLLNYNSKGCKDLSCYYQSSKWAVTLTHGLSKAFESNNSCQIQNKKLKWNSVKEGESNDYDFSNIMNLGSNSNASQISENMTSHAPMDMIDSSLNNSLSGRPMNSGDPTESNYCPNSNINGNSTQPMSQSTLGNSKIQPKFITSSNSSYLPSSSINQSPMNKVSQMTYYYNQDQLYSGPNSVSVSSHRSTPSSIPHSQSPQFHMGSSHQNLLQPPHSVPDTMKPASVESCNELLSSQINSQKSIPINQEPEMVPAMQRFTFVGNMYGNTNNMMNVNNMNPSRFPSRPPMYQTSIEPRPGSTRLFEGFINMNDEYRTEIRMFMEQSANFSFLSMESWDHHCVMHYVNYVDSYATSLYGKPSTELDLGSTDSGYKIPIELQIKMAPQFIEMIINNLNSKPNWSMIGIVRPTRPIPPDVHVQLICFVLSRQSSNIKVLIPADPKSLFNDIKNRTPAMCPGNQNNQLYNQMKRNNIGPNQQQQQQMYNMSQTMTPMHRQMMNRYGSHNTASMSMMNYRNMPHSQNFINHQMSANSNYILHPTVQNQTPNHMISMDMGMQSNPNLYEQNSYGLN